MIVNAVLPPVAIDVIVIRSLLERNSESTTNRDRRRQNSPLVGARTQIVTIIYETRAIVMKVSM